MRTMSGELNVGFVVFGDHVRRSHFEQLRQTDRVRITAVCDPSAQARHGASRVVDSVYQSLEEMLDKADVSALVICSPDRYHADMLARGIAEGKHVLVEKPLADQSAQLALVADTLDRAEREDSARPVDRP